MQKERIDTRLVTFSQIFLLLLPVVGLIIPIRHGVYEFTDRMAITIGLSVFSFVGILIQITTTKSIRVFFDNSFIYIKSRLDNKEEIISYHDVIELKEKNKKLQSKLPYGGGKFTLTYSVNKQVKKIIFYYSLDLQKVEKFKRQFSPEKLT